MSAFIPRFRKTNKSGTHQRVKICRKIANAAYARSLRFYIEKDCRFSKNDQNTHEIIER